MQRIMFENTFRFVLPPFPLLLHLLSLACMHTHTRTHQKIACTMQLNLLPIFFTILLPLPGKDTIFKHKMGVQADLRA